MRFIQATYLNRAETTLTCPITLNDFALTLVFLMEKRMKLRWIWILLYIERSLLSLCSKAKTNTPLMHKVPDKDTLKSKIPLHLSAAKHSYASKNGLMEVAVQWTLHRLKTSCRYQITSAFPCCRFRRPWAACPEPLALAVVSVCFFRAVTAAYVYGTIAFCLVFSKNFNIISALSARQSPTLPQKIDSRGGLFRCKKGVHVNVGKMNFYLKRPSFAPLSEIFGARFSAFWC